MQLIDPKQSLTVAYYRNPTSETFGNLQESALKAGFKPSYARQISGQKPIWLTENIQNDVKRVKRAEKNLDRYNDMEVGDIKNKTDVEKAKIQIDVSKFLLKTQARQKYSEQQEDTPPNVQINIVNYNEPLIAKDGGAIVKDAQVIDPQG